MKPSKNFLLAKTKPLRAQELEDFYLSLKRYYGHQNWWPAKTKMEMILGAILTQNTAWKNVEKAIVNLKKSKLIAPAALKKISRSELARLIRPSGYFNVKADRIKYFMDFLYRHYSGSLKKMFQEEGDVLREKLLHVKGIGPETADCILLYAGGKPYFVIDAYTRRVFSRHRWPLPVHGDYHHWQKSFALNLPQDPDLFNDFHAQIVHLAKDFCRSKQAFCEICPVSKYL